MNISIDTAQNVQITYKPAGIANRIFATVIDLALQGSIALIFLMIIPSGNKIIIVLFFTILGFYHLLCELFLNGRSPGKMTMHSRVVRLDGKKTTTWDYLLRWIFRLVDISASVGLIAMLSIIITKKMQRVGDLAAGTTVIYENPAISLNSLSTDETPQDYHVTFNEVLLLSDKDISVVREVFREVEKNKNYQLLAPLSQKIKDLTGIQTPMLNLEFIQTILRDYHHLTKE